MRHDRQLFSFSARVHGKRLASSRPRRPDDGARRAQPLPKLRRRLVWSIANPLLMLTVYVFFFGQVFPAKWALGGGGTGDFALILYVGLLIHGFLPNASFAHPV